MNINTEAAELLHAVADLYECGALKWAAFETHDTYPDTKSIIAALLACRKGHRREMRVLYRSITPIVDLINDPHDWQCQRGRNTRHVISMLRRAAQRLEEAK